MSRVSQKHTEPEIIVRRFLFLNGFRYRINYKKLPGSPDIVLPKFKTVIFVHGCFWHGHKNCKLAKRPSTNTSYWYKKIDENIKRDKRKAKEINKLGWKILTIWQCQIQSKIKSEKRLSLLLKQLREYSNKVKAYEKI
ncbi:MAG: very short patch repair endonuclease [Ignavibacteria bacterium RBG_16_35_7]|nr:MAG: very short patch repair endonuclease [Ignavibacteria bacterium RBG_16_35_7]